MSVATAAAAAVMAVEATFAYPIPPYMQSIHEPVWAVEGAVPAPAELLEDRVLRLELHDPPDWAVMLFGRDPCFWRECRDS